MQDKRENYDYEWELLYHNPEPKADISKWDSEYGPKVIERHPDGKAKSVQFNLLIDNPKIQVYIIGSFNKWQTDISQLGNYRLRHNDFSIFASITLDNIKHKERYKFLVIGETHQMILQDPAAPYFDDEGNSIFWDFEDPHAYRQKYPFIDNFNRPIKILQTELPGLVTHFSDEEGKCGSDIS